MHILDYIKHRNDELEFAYKELGDNIFWKTRRGDDTRVSNMSLSHISEVLDMLNSKDPDSYWIQIFENEQRKRRE